MITTSSTDISQPQPEVIKLDDRDKYTMVAPSCTDVLMDQLQPSVHIPHPDDVLLEATLWVDSVFYTIGVHAIIIGTIAPLYHHLNKGKDFEEFLERFDALGFDFVLGWYALMALMEVWFFHNLRWGRFLGRISHVFGFLAMFLILKLVSLPLALVVFIPTFIWGIIVVVYSFSVMIHAFRILESRLKTKKKRDSRLIVEEATFNV